MAADLQVYPPGSWRGLLVQASHYRQAGRHPLQMASRERRQGFGREEEIRPKTGPKSEEGSGGVGRPTSQPEPETCSRSRSQIRPLQAANRIPITLRTLQGLRELTSRCIVCTRYKRTLKAVRLEGARPFFERKSQVSIATAYPGIWIFCKEMFIPFKEGVSSVRR